MHIVASVLLAPAERMELFYYVGFVPEYFSGYFIETMSEFPWFAPFGLITHTLIHGSWTHLAFNTVMMLALGTFFERIYGARKTAIFFVICSVVGAMLYFVFDPFSTSPVIGASGGISGFFGAMLYILGKTRQMGQLGQKGPWPVIIFWAGLMIVMGLIGGNVAWQAHLGGFLTGVILVQLRFFRAR